MRRTPISAGSSLRLSASPLSRLATGRPESDLGGQTGAGSQLFVFFLQEALPFSVQQAADSPASEPPGPESAGQKEEENLSSVSSAPTLPGEREDAGEELSSLASCSRLQLPLTGRAGSFQAPRFGLKRTDRKGNSHQGCGPSPGTAGWVSGKGNRALPPPASAPPRCRSATCPQHSQQQDLWQTKQLGHV